MTDMPTYFAIRCSNELYRSFKLRGWVQGASEQLCRDKNISILSHLRGTRVSLSSRPNAIHDIEDFLSSLPALKEREHISQLFKLRCLCLTDRAPSLRVVTFGSIRTDNLSCRATDVVLPVHSFLARLPQSVPVCTSDRRIRYNQY